jgi:hypothetical protein
MNDATLTEELARQVLGWRVAPDRFMKSGRSWIPKWRFSPLVRLEDAFQLLDVVASGYRLEGCKGGMFTAKVRVGRRIGKASGELKGKGYRNDCGRGLRSERTSVTSWPSASQRAGSATTVPYSPAVNLAIPDELLARPQWIAWWSVVGDGRRVQLPNGRLTDVLNVHGEAT